MYFVLTVSPLVRVDSLSPLEYNRVREGAVNEKK